MKLYNKGGRAIIISKEDIISGGRANEHDVKKDRLYMDPSTSMDVKDELGTKLLGMYPQMLVRMDEPKDKPKKRPAVKKALAKTKKR